MGWLEHIIVTPSHHRVHHAINPEYIDRNFSQIFIIWDKLFGTFQPELENVAPVYGVTRPVRTWNPVKINFLHLWLLMKDAWHAKKWKDKLRIWFMPLGWRPADVTEQYPVYKIEDVYNFTKYDPQYSKALLWWSWMQLTSLLLLTSYLFANIATIGSPGIYLYGVFIFLSVYAFTELMDRKSSSVFWEIAKSLFGFAIIIKTGSWFNSDSYHSMIKFGIAAWFIICVAVCLWFVLYELKRNPALHLTPA